MSAVSSISSRMFRFLRFFQSDYCPLSGFYVKLKGTAYYNKKIEISFKHFSKRWRDFSNSLIWFWVNRVKEVKYCNLKIWSDRIAITLKCLIYWGQLTVEELCRREKFSSQTVRSTCSILLQQDVKLGTILQEEEFKYSKV
jgi:hypothetical protein